MAIIPRKFQKIFAGLATNNGQFGSAQAGTKITSTDLDVLQALTAYSDGWLDATIGSRSVPTLEEMQSLNYIATTQLAYIFQEGVAEYDATTEYRISSVVKKPGTSQIYVSQQNANTGNPLTNATYWRIGVDLGSYNSTVIPNITGFLPGTIAGTSTTATITQITGGVATDETQTVYVVKPTVTNWAVTNGNALNGYQGGTTLPNSSTIHFFMIQKSDGTLPGSFASTSLVPTLPTTHTGGVFRRIFSLKTDGSGALIPIQNVVEIGGGAITSFLTTPSADVNVSNLGATATLYTLNVPQDITVQPLVQSNLSSAGTYLITSPFETDVAVSATQNDGTQNSAAHKFLITNTFAQIRARADASSRSLSVVTRGWNDFRRGL